MPLAIEAQPKDKEIEMNIKLVVSTAACAVFFAGTAVAAEQTVSNPDPVSGFGSGTGMGAGGGAGSASSVADGFGAQTRGSGAGSQTFGGGFNQQKTAGSGPLSSNPSAATAGGSPVTAGGPAMTVKY